VPYAVLGNKIHQNLLAEGTSCKLVFQIDVQLPKIQTIAQYQHGLLISNDDWPHIQVPWDPGGHHHLNIVLFSTSVWVWDPGDLEQICLLFLRRLGDKPCYKEGSTSQVQVWNDVRLTLNTNDLQVPWDPGGFEFVLDISTTAWGQAVFQGEKYVRDLMGWPGRLAGW
jgi:hypothetical protein